MWSYRGLVKLSSKTKGSSQQGKTEGSRSRVSIGITPTQFAANCGWAMSNFRELFGP